MTDEIKLTGGWREGRYNGITPLGSESYFWLILAIGKTCLQLQRGHDEFLLDLARGNTTGPGSHQLVASNPLHLFFDSSYRTKFHRGGGGGGGVVASCIYHSFCRLYAASCQSSEEFYFTNPSRGRTITKVKHGYKPKQQQLTMRCDTAKRSKVTQQNVKLQRGRWWGGGGGGGGGNPECGGVKSVFYFLFLL